MLLVEAGKERKRLLHVFTAFLHLDLAVWKDRADEMEDCLLRVQNQRSYCLLVQEYTVLRPLMFFY